MIKTLNPYPNPAKTAEIMSRYRPIAPKPETSPNSSMSEGSCSSLSQKINQSPYLRNLWPQLQARPTRTRKRGRAPLTLPSSSLKRHKTTHILGFCPPCHVVTSSPAKNLSFQGFAPLPNHGLGVLNCTMENNNTLTANPSLVTLPLLPCSPCPAPKLESNSTLTKPCVGEVIDLNTKVSVPEEKDLLQQLQKPVSSNINVITPQPVRPIGSSISVVCISEDLTLPPLSQTPKRPNEVEQEVENEPLPAVISDSNHRIRMANSAYKEMVGQPLCPWLESMVNNNGGGECKRISGEVTLHLSDSTIVPTSSNGFSCWVRIEWQSEHNNKKNCVNAFCDVMKLACESRDYLFTWRFHTRTTREASQSSCNA
ncbi:hypothetical protein AAZX31_14G087400 [Glycine max]|uniref:DUF7950 domain-containing protein n=2 Tax=Glycine subgen. Soja TaxID=1462606 RepID=I1M8U6_SOYBN|nr:uncharacterized protein LOC100800670 [Glycine max]XP_028199864.1 uncharacterized protein LOC114384392 [Glycine soja]KAG4382465.1 hypothetical protein GLYMA_14G089033v4 [Glycine max]KAG4953604.1 hypothetical protein JHK87_039198 [Glycine soja]KAG4962533.1 hypothetical protein JHK86_039401 [Glycine max]KAG4965005.1 hypothetical protein JHK85_039980 [Glycine max]KAG5110001.1 hypothetical protein JHK82_039224 [Glycine max]|eukprot:XP_003545343.1 uncharacterized protein LOC100800670 [Glycine max]